MISDIHSQPEPRRRPIGRRGRPAIQDEFTHRTDLTRAQKYHRRAQRRLPHSHSKPRPSGIYGKGAMLLRTERTNLGLALLQTVAIPGVPLTFDDIAAWCDCSRQNVEMIAAGALRKIRNALMFRDREVWEELRAHLTLFADRQPAARRRTGHAG